MKLIITIFTFTLFLINPVFGEEATSKHYDVVNVEVTMDELPYKAIVYVPRQVKIKSMLVISATIGGVDAVEISNAQFFSRHGYVVILPLPFLTELAKKNPDTEKLDNDYFRPITSAELLIKAVENKLTLAPDLPIFALGASQGGITTLLLASAIPRIKAAWSAVAGGDLPYIYANSEVKKIVEFKKNHMSTLGINNDDEYEDYLRAHLKNDPVISCKEIKVPFAQVIAKRDVSVPTQTQELLARECPSHKILRFNYNHQSGILSTLLLREQIKDFFEAAI